MADEDLRRLSADLRSAGRRVKAQARAVVAKTAFDIEATAKSIVAVDTGNLKGSIGHSDASTRGLSGSYAMEIGPTANYGVFLEMGTSRAAPQPFMGPAADRHAPSFEQAMEQIGMEGLNG